MTPFIPSVMLTAGWYFWAVGAASLIGAPLTFALAWAAEAVFERSRASLPLADRPQARAVRVSSSKAVTKSRALAGAGTPPQLPPAGGRGPVL